MTRTNDGLESARQALLAWFPDGAAVLAAVSGGIDSMCLLHLLHTWGAQHGFSVTAAHFNHGLRGETALRDQEFVRAYCRMQKIPFLTDAGDTRALAEAEGKSIEEAGRLLRYRFLHSAAETAGCRWILTAHHADDSAETMLLNLIRGTGSAGLGGIPARRDGVCRPFLGITRQTISNYAAEHKVPHMEDETNGTDEASRNVIRHQILPVLRQLNPRAVEHMTRTAEILSAEDRLLEELAQQAAAGAAETETGLGISCETLNHLPEALRGRAALHLMERVCGRRKDLTEKHVSAVLELSGGVKDGQISLPYHLLARRIGETLTIERAEPLPMEAALHPDAPVRFGNWIVWLNGENAAVPQEAEHLWLDRRVLTQPLRITCWRPSDFMKLPGTKGARSLKRLCVERGISPARRETLPVVRIEEKPIAVPVVGVSEEFAPLTREHAVRLVFQYEKNGNQDTEE